MTLYNQGAELLLGVFLGRSYGLPTVAMFQPAKRLSLVPYQSWISTVDRSLYHNVRFAESYPCGLSDARDEIRYVVVFRYRRGKMESIGQKQALGIRNSSVFCLTGCWLNENAQIASHFSVLTDDCHLVTHTDGLEQTGKTNERPAMEDIQKCKKQTENLLKNGIEEEFH
jgi:hypothetical protein